MEPSFLGRRKKLNGRQGALPFVVPNGLLRLVLLSIGVGLTAVELGLPVLRAHPHNLPPARRIRNHPDDRGATALSTPPPFESPPPQRHRKLGPRRVLGSGGVIAAGLSVPAPHGELAPMLLAPAPHRGRMTTRAVPTAGPRTALATRSAAIADQRKKRWPPIFRIVELVERRTLPHEMPFADLRGVILSHTLTSNEIQ
jgi:hypothetical protein